MNQISLNPLFLLKGNLKECNNLVTPRMVKRITTVFDSSYKYCSYCILAVIPKNFDSELSFILVDLPWMYLGDLIF